MKLGVTCDQECAGKTFGGPTGTAKRFKIGSPCPVRFGQYGGDAVPGVVITEHESSRPRRNRDLRTGPSWQAAAFRRLHESRNRCEGIERFHAVVPENRGVVNSPVVIVLFRNSNRTPRRPPQ